MSDSHTNNQVVSGSGYRESFGDEINLLDLWLIFLKYKWLAAVVFASVMFLVAGYLLMVKPVYLSRAVIAVGYIPDPGSIRSQTIPGVVLRNIESPKLLVKRLLEKYQTTDGSPGLVLKPPALYSVIYDEKNGEGVIELSVIAGTPEGAQEFLYSVVNDILVQHKARYDHAYAGLELAVESRKEVLDKIDGEISKILALTDSKNMKDPNQSANLYMRLNFFSQQRLDAEKQYDELKIRVDAKFDPTVFLREPTLPGAYYKPKVNVIVMMAFVIAAFLGVFSVFVADFFFSAQKYVRRNQN